MATWAPGDRFQVQRRNCILEQPDVEGLIFEITKFGRAKGRGRRGPGWYFYAPFFDRDRDARWYSQVQFEQREASGEILRLQTVEVAASDPSGKQR